MMAAQQWAAISREHPMLNDDFSRGDFSKATDWRRKNIWEKASTASTPDLMRQATGEPLNAKYFIAHLQARYG
jgi:carboxypeptidase Taq